MEDSLLYSLLSNELEIAGMRATHSNESSDVSHTSSTFQSIPHKRHHSIDLPGRQAAASYGPGSRSYPESGLHRSLEAAAEEAAGLWCSSLFPNESVQAAAAPLSCSPPTGGQPCSSGGAVHQLKMLLASDSTVREAALKLLLQGSGPKQQQQSQAQGSRLQGTQRARTALLAPQQQQQDSMWGEGDGDDATFHTDSLGLLPAAGSSRMLHINPQHSQHSGSPQRRFTEPPAGRMPAQHQAGHSAGHMPAQHHAGHNPAGRMPAQSHAGCAEAADEGIDDWVNMLESQLLGCLREQQTCTMAAAAGAGALHSPAGARSSSNAAGLMPMQQQMQAQGAQQQHLPPQRPHRHYHAAHPPKPHPAAQAMHHQRLRVASAPPCRFSASLLSTIDSITRTTVEGSRSPDFPGFSSHSSPDLAGSASSSSNNNSAVLAGCAHSLYSNQSSGSAGLNFHSQPLPTLALQEQGVAVHGGLKRHNSIDQDQLLLSLLNEIVPSRR